MDLVYAEKVDGPRQVHNHVEIGHCGPLDCTALGKALLAALPGPAQDELVARLSIPSDLAAELVTTRRRGYAVNEEEHEVGVRSVAVSVAAVGPCPPSAICVTAPVFRRSRQDLHRCVPLLVESAEQIRRQLLRETMSGVPDSAAPAELGVADS